MLKNTKKLSNFQKARATINFINEGTRLGVPNVNERIAKLLNVADNIDAVLIRAEDAHVNGFFMEILFSLPSVFGFKKEDGYRVKLLQVFERMEYMKDMAMFGNTIYKASLSQLEYVTEFLNGIASRFNKYMDLVCGGSVKVTKSINQLGAALQGKQKNLRDLKKLVPDEGIRDLIDAYLFGIDYLLSKDAKKEIEEVLTSRYKNYEEYATLFLDDITSFVDDVRKLNKKMNPINSLLLDKQKVEGR